MNDRVDEPPFNVVIPARFGSTRLPGKPLEDLGGQPMILRTVEQARRSGAHEVVVATDDRRILDACEKGACDALMTSSDHQSGTDRLCEVATKLGWAEDQIVINVQGDEPFIPPETIAQVAALVAQGPADIATLATPLENTRAFEDPNIVKVVRNREGMALYFSRASIPFRRDDEENTVQPLRHIGIYGYRNQTLRRFAAAGSCDLEQREKLEQLRALWHGWPIRVGMARTVPGPGVDTLEDLAAARELMRRSGRT